MYTYVCSYDVDNNHTAAFINTRAEMKSFYQKLTASKNVRNILVSIRTVTVDFGNGRLYTYLSNDDYRRGDKIFVPTPSGAKLATVRYTNLQTKSELETIAKANGFTFADYKLAIGRKL